MPNREYFVFYDDTKIGDIFEFESGAIGFQYDPQWIKSGFAISHSLPFRAEEYKQEANRYFANLLPEGDIRTTLATKLGISVENDFRLLIALGGECAGALTIGKAPRPLESRYEKINLIELVQRFKGGETLLSSYQDDDEEIRFSLAGAQDKLPVFVKDGVIYLPHGNSPSTHILKPPSHRFHNVPECEYLMAKLAQKVGLEVARAELVQLDGINACLIDRYDRMITSNQVRRLHQEDFCQALNVSPKAKYESGGGPTFAKIYKCVEDNSQHLPHDLERIVQWLIFNVVIGNCDGHAKNVSLLRNSKGDWQLSPHYDLVPTRVFAKVTTRLAMSIGGTTDSGTVTGTHWKRLASEIKIGVPFLLKTVKEMAESAPEKFKMVANEFIGEHGESPVIQQIERVIYEQTRRLLTLLQM